MQPAQADAARALFASVLNERGLKLLDGVRLLEGVLREQQGSFRDPGRYYVSVFGTPGRFPWGWRFEGHHLSLNVALAGRRPRRGDAVLRRRPSRHRARRPQPRLPPAGRLRGSRPPDHGRPHRAAAAAAIIADRSFGEIVASPQREQDLGQPTRPGAAARWTAPSARWSKR